VDYRDILAVLGCADSPCDRQALHALVPALRGKIEADPQRPAPIVNEARIGYRLAAEANGPGRPGAGEQATEGGDGVSSSASRFVAE